MAKEEEKINIINTSIEVSEAEYKVLVPALRGLAMHRKAEDKYYIKPVTGYGAKIISMVMKAKDEKEKEKGE